MGPRRCISHCSRSESFPAMRYSCPLTFVATANAVRYVGGEPVFVDVDAKTWCIDPKRLEAAITPRTKGIIAVHLYGHPADMDEIKRVATAHSLG